MWTLILLGGRLHLLGRTVSLHLGRWTLWGPVLDGRPDMVRQSITDNCLLSSSPTITNFPVILHYYELPIAINELPGYEIH